MCKKEKASTNEFDCEHLVGGACPGMSASMWVVVILGLCGGELWLLRRIQSGLMQRHLPLYSQIEDGALATIKHSVRMPLAV